MAAMRGQGRRGKERKRKEKKGEEGWACARDNLDIQTRNLNMRHNLARSGFGLGKKGKGIEGGDIPGLKASTMRSQKQSNKNTKPII